MRNGKAAFAIPNFRVCDRLRPSLAFFHNVVEHHLQMAEDPSANNQTQLGGNKCKLKL